MAGERQMSIFPEPWFPPTNAAWREAEPWYPIPQDERDDFSEPIPCPDCEDGEWVLGATVCPECGVLLADIGDRLAR